ncbi:MAG TPA: bifunctional 4-hydroxy-2-oxoglutarate aldolase/2-dehydro-3-deoxy-phosphogluconate aldolase, partial [Polyangiaceae bacterium]|nr:bifunctional 4-hydroxy-2-oxoglutarate aldolase/2-dehydro-3-deoxy-phosphogluconate aldolase [Polyangiaceae bacterium]
ALEQEIPYIPGALTPSEVWTAREAGAALIKLFPIQFYGPSYIRELRGPFGEVPLLACGGIRPDNLREYLEAGVDAVALGASTFRRDWLSSGNVDALTETISTLVSIVKAFHSRRPSGFMAQA